jgi:hypothetical protein
MTNFSCLADHGCKGQHSSLRDDGYKGTIKGFRGSVVVRAGLYDVASTWQGWVLTFRQTSRNCRRGTNQMMPRVADCGVRFCQETSIGSLHITTHHNSVGKQSGGRKLCFACCCSDNFLEPRFWKETPEKEKALSIRAVVSCVCVRNCIGSTGSLEVGEDLDPQ